MTVEDLIKVVSSSVEIYKAGYNFSSYNSGELLYEGAAQDVPYKLINLEVLEVQVDNHYLKIRVNE